MKEQLEAIRAAALSSIGATNAAAELDALRRQIIQSEYRNDPAQIERMEILSNVEPYRDLGLNQVLNLWEKGVVDDVTMELKSGFADYIARFEREN